MENQTKTGTSVAIAAPTDISLIRGGPFYRVEVAFKLVESDR